jgi:putative sterol carrier protein
MGMSLESVKQQITQKLALASALNARAKFDFGDEGRLFVDATQTPPVMSESDEEADVTLLCSLSTFEGFLNGTQNPNLAFMMGKLKVKGSMGLAMKLNGILED